MTNYQGISGVWVLYDYDVGPYIVAQATEPEVLIRRASQQAYGRVGYWPYDMDFREAIDWWEARPPAEETKAEVKEEDIVHFFYTSYLGPPVCKDIKQYGWVKFDARKPGAICMECQKAVGWQVKE